MGVFGSVLNEY